MADDAWRQAVNLMSTKEGPMDAGVGENQESDGAVKMRLPRGSPKQGSSIGGKDELFCETFPTDVRRQGNPTRR